MLLRAGEVPGLQVWTRGLLPHEVGRAVPCHLQGVCRHQQPTFWQNTTGSPGAMRSIAWDSMRMLSRGRIRRTQWRSTWTFIILKTSGILTVSTTLLATFKKRLERQISEGVAIMKTDEKVQANRQQHILMNSKSEHKSLQPAVHRQITIRGVRNGS